MNIFAPRLRTVEEMADKNLLIIGHIQSVSALHQCKLYLSSPSELRLYHLGYCGIFIRNGIKGFSKVDFCSPIKLGGNVDLSALRFCHGNELWVGGEAKHFGLQGNNTLFLHRKDPKPGEYPWWSR